MRGKAAILATLMSQLNETGARSCDLEQSFHSFSSRERFIDSLSFFELIYRSIL
jgi:hypothetical protein